MVSALLLGMLAASPAPATPALAWSKVDGAFFAVTVPGKSEVKETTQVLEGIGGIKTTEYVFFEEAEIHVSVNTSEFPAEYIQKSVPTKLLESGRDGAIANIGGKLKSDKPATLEKWPGRIFSAELPQNLFLRQAVFLVDKTFIQIVYVAPKSKDSPKDFQRVISSLKLKKAAEKAD